MTTAYVREHIVVGVTRAAFTDAVAVGATVVRYVAVDPLLCRLRGHKPVTLATPEPLTLCLRCGSPCRAR